MSLGFVADSSVGVAWAVASQSGSNTDHLLDEVASGRPFVVPVLWTLEIGNALLVLKRRRRITPGECARGIRALRSLNPVVDPDGPGQAWDRIWTLAEEHSLSTYDAAYLELALRRGLPLASRDDSLNRAARRCGVTALLA